MRPLLILHIWRNMQLEVAEFTNSAILSVWTTLWQDNCVSP